MRDRSRKRFQIFRDRKMDVERRKEKWRMWVEGSKVRLGFGQWGVGRGVQYFQFLGDLGGFSVQNICFVGQRVIFKVVLRMRIGCKGFFFIEVNMVIVRGDFDYLDEYGVITVLCQGFINNCYGIFFFLSICFNMLGLCGLLIVSGLFFFSWVFYFQQVEGGYGDRQSVYFQVCESFLFYVYYQLVLLG